MKITPEQMIKEWLEDGDKKTKIYYNDLLQELVNLHPHPPINKVKRIYLRCLSQGHAKWAYDIQLKYDYIFMTSDLLIAFGWSLMAQQLNKDKL